MEIKTVENRDIENVGNYAFNTTVSFTGVGNINGFRVSVKLATLASECRVDTSLNYTVILGRLSNSSNLEYDTVDIAYV